MSFGGGTPGTLGAGTMHRDPASNDEQEPKILFSLNQSSSSPTKTRRQGLRGTVAVARDARRRAAAVDVAAGLRAPRLAHHAQRHVSEQLRELFSSREMKDGDHIVFAPGTYHLDSTVILYDHDAESQILRNITLRGTPGDVLICAEEACGLDHLFVCRDLDPFYKGPGTPRHSFSGLNFRNDHSREGATRSSAPLATSTRDESARPERSRDAREGSLGQNRLGKFRRASVPGTHTPGQGGREACVANGVSSVGRRDLAPAPSPTPRGYQD